MSIDKKQSLDYNFYHIHRSIAWCIKSINIPITLLRLFGDLGEVGYQSSIQFVQHLLLGFCQKEEL